MERFHSSINILPINVPKTFDSSNFLIGLVTCKLALAEENQQYDTVEFSLFAAEQFKRRTLTLPLRQALVSSPTLWQENRRQRN